MRRDLSIFLFFIGLFFFGWPILSIFNDGMAFYLFTAWLLFIVFIYIAATFSQREDNNG